MRGSVRDDFSLQQQWNPSHFVASLAVRQLSSSLDIQMYHSPVLLKPSAPATLSFLLNSDNFPINPVYLKLFKTDFHSLQPRTSRILGCPPKAAHHHSVRGAISGKSSGPSLLRSGCWQALREFCICSNFFLGPWEDACWITSLGARQDNDRAFLDMRMGDLGKLSDETQTLEPVGSCG